jgi:hypothetical protein
MIAVVRVAGLPGEEMDVAKMQLNDLRASGKIADGPRPSDRDWRDRLPEAEWTPDPSR